MKLSLRDWFAGKALAALLVADVTSGLGMPESAAGYNRIMPPDEAAERAYAYADAMLGEAAKQQPECVQVGE